MIKPKIFKSKNLQSLKVTHQLNEINIWSLATDEDKNRAKRLPHIYQVVNEWNLLATGNYWDPVACRVDFDAITNYRKALNFAAYATGI